MKDVFLNNLQVIYHVIVVAALAAIALFNLFDRVANGRARYLAFKSLSKSEDRRHALVGRVIRPAISYGASAAVGLVLIGRVSYIYQFPDVFFLWEKHVILQFPAIKTTVLEIFSPSGLFSVAVGAIASIVALSVISFVKGRDGIIVIGDVRALLPRNVREGGICCIMAINAGISEELYFRLFLPILVSLICGSIFTGFLVACAIFGISHAYQGWKGVVATTLVGMMLSIIYIASNSLLTVIVIHIAINIRSLIVGPALNSLLVRTRPNRLFKQNC